jgi:hypothetical protein
MRAASANADAKANLMSNQQHEQHNTMMKRNASGDFRMPA